MKSKKRPAKKRKSLSVIKKLEEYRELRSIVAKRDMADRIEQRYYDNLQSDLEAIAKNPKLIPKFKKIYPEKFHQFLKYKTKPCVLCGRYC